MVFVPFITFNDYNLYSYENNNEEIDKHYLEFDDIYMKKNIDKDSQVVDTSQIIINETRSQSQTKVSNQKINLKEPFPRSSFLTEADFLQYSTLKTESELHPLDHKALIKFKELHSRIIAEQNDYNKYLEYIAEKYPESYHYISKAGTKFIKDLYAYNLKRVHMMPKYFAFFDTISLNITQPLSNKTNHLVHLQKLLEMGNIQEFSELPLNLNVCISRNYKAIKDKHKHLLPEAVIPVPYELENDAIILGLSEKYGVNVSICEAALFCLFDNQPTQWGSSWELIVKVIEGKDKRKCVFINKPFLGKNSSIVDRNKLFTKYALRTTMVSKNSISLDQISDYCSNNKNVDLNIMDSYNDNSNKNIVNIKNIERYIYNSLSNTADINIDRVVTDKDNINMNKDEIINLENFIKSSKSDTANIHISNLDISKTDINIMNCISNKDNLNIDFKNSGDNDYIDNDLIKQSIKKSSIDLKNSVEAQFEASLKYEDDEVGEDDVSDDNLVIDNEMSDNDVKEGMPKDFSESRMSCGKCIKDDALLAEKTDLTNALNTSINVNIDLNALEECSDANMDLHVEKSIDLNTSKTCAALNNDLNTSRESIDSNALKDSINNNLDALSPVRRSTRLSDKLKLSPLLQCKLAANKTSASSLNTKVSESHKLNKSHSSLPSKIQPKNIVNHKNNDTNKSLAITINNDNSREKTNNKTRTLKKSSIVDSSSLDNNKPIISALNNSKCSNVNSNSLDNKPIIPSSNNTLLDNIKPILRPASNSILNNTKPSRRSNIHTSNPLDEILVKQSTLLTNWQNKPFNSEGTPYLNYPNFNSNTESNMKTMNTISNMNKNMNTNLNTCFTMNTNMNIDSNINNQKPLHTLKDLEDLKITPNIEPLKYGNTSYDLWQLGDLKLLISQKYDAFQVKNNKKNGINIFTKLEYQSEHGFEILTLSDLARSWLTFALKPNVIIKRVRIDAVTSELLKIEDLSKESLRQFVPWNYLNQLEAILNSLSKLDLGTYLLSHQSGNSYIQIKRQTFNSNGTYDLHFAHEQALSRDYVNVMDHWLPIDTSLKNQHHLMFNKIPCTFEPKDLKRKKKSPKYKKKSSKKRTKQKYN